MRFNDFICGIAIYLISLFSVLIITNILQFNIVDEVAIVIALTYLLIVPMVVCTRIILRAVKGSLKWDSLEQKIKRFF